MTTSEERATLRFYPDKYPRMENETIPYHSHLHWIIFFWPVLTSAGGIFLYLNYPILRQVSFLLMGFGLIWILVTVITYCFSSLVIQAGQVILTTGLFVRESANIPIQKIESIDIRQPLMGSIFHYGSLMIRGTGGTNYSIHYLNQPLTCRRKIEQLIGQQ